MSEEVSNFKVPVTIIRSLSPHPNADRLEIAIIYGFSVVVQKGIYKPGEVIIYCPIDAILSAEVERALFTPDSKIKLDRGRVRQIKIRGVVSQGMCIPPSEMMPLIAEYAKANKMKEITIEPEQDLSVILGITKYEPGPKGLPSQPAIKRNKPKENPLLHKYGGCENLKWRPDFFDGKEVVVQEKLHGTNARYALLPNLPNTLWKKILNLFGLLPKEEFCYGSNNVQLQSKGYRNGFYDEDVYSKMIKQEQIDEKLLLGETIFGEIIGPGIQNNYHYGIPQGKHRLVIFDVKFYDGVRTRWLSPDEVRKFATLRGFEVVPELYRGPFNLEGIQALTKGNSVYAPKQKVREGVVIKAIEGYDDEFCGKMARKLISEDYLADMKNSDNH